MSCTGRFLALLCSFALLLGGVAGAQEMSQAPSDGALVLLQEVRLSGVTVFEEGELVALLSDAIGKEATLEDLEAMAAAITRYYRDAGYPLARAYVPAQTVEDRVVHIVVV